MPWVQDIAGLPAFVYWAILTLALGVASAGLLKGFGSLRRARLIEDVPTAKVRSAHQGYLELIGVAQAMEGEPIVAPLSGVQCCWYRYRIEERDRHSWDLVRRGESDGLFLLRDDTGDCVVDPEGAAVSAQHLESWFGDGGLGGFAGVHHRGLKPVGWLEKLADAGIRVTSSAIGAGARFRYTEEVILPGDPVYAIGHFKSYDDIDHRRNREEVTAQILREWKQRPATLKERFDQNRDGYVDPQEWEHARGVAARQAVAAYAEQMQGQQLHSLSLPTEQGLPYLISNLAQFSLTRRYRWRGAGGLVLFFFAGSLATLLLSARFVT